MSYITTLGDYLSTLFAENINAEDFIFINFSELQISEQSKPQLKYEPSRTDITLPGEYLSVRCINCKNTAGEIIKKWKEMENIGFPLSSITKAFINIDSEQAQS